MQIKALITLILLALATLCSAHDYSKNDLHVAHPWARPTAIKTVPAAVYFEVRNRGNTVDRLQTVSIPDSIAKNVEIHENSMHNGMMRMREIEEPIIIDAGGILKFTPGGKHIMLRGLSERLVEGQSFPMDLVFEKAGKIPVIVKVENPAAVSDEKITPKVERPAL